MITGAGSGIGYAIAEKFHSENHRLILLVRNNIQKKKLEKKFSNNKNLIISGDLSNYNFLKKVSKKINYVHNLINNAATRNAKHFFKVKKEELDYLMKINFKSIYFLTQEMAKKMVKKKIKGSIVNLSSQLGHVAAYNRTAYCSSKFAIEGFTKSTALDLAKYKIRVNSIAPTKVISTNNYNLNSKKRLKYIVKKIPLRQFTEKDDIATICHFLTTDACKNITGASIKVDGGWTAGN